MFIQCLYRSFHPPRRLFNHNELGDFYVKTNVVFSLTNIDRLIVCLMLLGNNLVAVSAVFQ